MALDNVISVTFSSEELKKISDSLAEIEAVLKGKTFNLSPDERKQYGSIADRNKVWVDKCKTYMDSDPKLIPPTLDKAEFDRDYNARQAVDVPLKRMARIVQMLTDTKTLLDFDNYNASLACYNYVKFLASQNEAGATSVFQDLKKHFSNKTKSTDETNATPSEPSTEA